LEIGFSYYETLTGFKYIGNLICDVMEKGKEFLFAYEDAIGYLPGPLSFDKDGVR
jgi:phosphomannomutase